MLFQCKKNRCSRLLMVFQVPAVRERYIYCLTVCFCEAWATWISRRLFPIQVSYFDGYTTKPTLIFCAWQLISESVSMRILTHLYALVHASTASCLYCNGAILWNRYKRQSPSLKLFRTPLKAIRNLDLRPKTKSYRFKNFGCRELT